MSDIDKFVTPESMLTPGLAGGMTMGITNALAFQFALDAPQPAAIALALSFVFGLCVFSAKSGRRGVKALFWVVNSLVIFTVAAGSNSLGVAASSAKVSAAAPATARAWIEGLVPSAHAQSATKWCCLEGSVLQATAEVCARKHGKTTDTKAQALQACQAAPAAPAPAKQPPHSQFFRPWVKPA
jgi:hypothetical protein